MAQSSHLLLLAGSGEAREIANSLAALPVRVTASLYESDHWSGPLTVPARKGGFGGDGAFAAFLRQQKITAVMDATHPFAARVSARSWQICHAAQIPYLQLDRPAWTPSNRDHWQEVDTAEEAVAATPPHARVFVTTGRETLPAFVHVTDRRFFFRKLGAAECDAPADHIRFVTGEGPFSVQEETDLFASLAIDALICKNAGGVLSHTKLEAARDLGLPVILLRRPPHTGAPTVSTVSEALHWVHQTCL